MPEHWSPRTPARHVGHGPRGRRIRRLRQVRQGPCPARPRGVPAPVLAVGAAVALALPLLAVTGQPAGAGAGAPATARSLAARSASGGSVTGDLPPQGRGLRLATFNVLGANHTDEGGNKASWRGYRWRMRRTVEMLDRYRISVAGLQEFQPRQQREFRSLTGDTWSISPDGMPVTGIVWRRARWTLKRSGSITIPYMPNKPMELPYVLLDPVGKHRKPVWFLNVHNPSDAWGDAAGKRREAIRRELRLVRRRLEGGPHPVVVTGDFNSRREAFCRMARAGLHASAGGDWTRRRGCTPPDDLRIDWLFGTPAAGFSGHLVNTHPRARGFSDHPLVVTVVRPPYRR